MHKLDNSSDLITVIFIYNNWYGALCVVGKCMCSAHVRITVCECVCISMFMYTLKMIYVFVFYG